MPVLSDLVSVRTRYRRAVNLSADRHDIHALDDILVTPLVAHALNRLLDNLENEQGERSFMIFGPYGAGKSTFTLFVNALFSEGAHKKIRPTPNFVEILLNLPNALLNCAKRYAPGFVCR